MALSVSTQHPDYTANVDKWQDCRNFYMGEDRVKKLGQRYLPKPSAATDEEYQSYVSRAFFYGVVESTVNGLCGSVFRKAPSKDLPSNIDYLVNNADGERSSLDQFSKNVFSELLLTGRVGILVDRPREGGQVYLTLFPAEDIINWQYNFNSGLTLVVLRERYYEPSSEGSFDLTERVRYRELRIENGKYIQRTWIDASPDPSGDNAEQVDTENQNEPHESVEPTKQGVSLTEIPFVFCNASSTTPDVDKPPLLELVRKNNEHYRVSADYANTLYFAGQPILWVKGVPKEDVAKLKVGSSYAFMLGSDEASMGYLEVSGRGIAPNKERADDIKGEMAVLGARLLENQRNGIEAAETAYLRQNGEMSKLMSLVVSCNSAIRKALEFADKWEGGNGDKITFSLNTDFIDVVINPQLLSTLAQLVKEELISWDTFIYNLMAGEILPPDRTPEQERDLIATQPPMSPAAEQATQMQTAMQQAQLNALASTGKE